MRAVAAAPVAEADPFAAPTVISPAGTADLFASAMGGAAAPAVAAPAPSSPFLFGGGSTVQSAEPAVSRSSGGNGAGSTHLTGQRNENSVLFSLSNLEALAVPAQSGGIRSPSASTNTEGSGLIDIRSMAAMTLSDGSPGDVRRSFDALPTFSTPQFSPVAPVLLPMSTGGPPKWAFPVLGLLSVGILSLGFIIFKVVTAPPPGLAPVPVAPVPVATAPVAPVAGVAAPAAAQAAEAAKPAATEEKPAAAASEAKPADKSKTGSGKGDKGRRKGGDQASAGKGGAESKKGGESAGASSPSAGEGASAAKPAGRKGAKSLDDLLGEVGSKKGGGDEGSPKAASVKLISLGQSDIVGAMKGVQPKVQACANQFKVPGTAMANISVATGGRVSMATVTGKFAGTPTGSCVESAAKSAKFPPCQAMTFPWPFTLSPR
jgi:hypothetical protein